MNNSKTGKRNQETAFRYSKLQTIKYRGDRKMRVMVIGSKTIPAAGHRTGFAASYKSQKPVNGSVIYVVYLCNDVHGIACGSFWINSTVCKPEKIVLYQLYNLQTSQNFVVQFEPLVDKFL